MGEDAQDYWSSPRRKWTVFSRLNESNSNAGDDQKDKQIRAELFLRRPLASSYPASNGIRAGWDHQHAKEGEQTLLIHLFSHPRPEKAASWRKFTKQEKTIRIRGQPIPGIGLVASFQFRSVFQHHIFVFFCDDEPGDMA